MSSQKQKIKATFSILILSSFIVPGYVQNAIPNSNTESDKVSGTSEIHKPMFRNISSLSLLIPVNGIAEGATFGIETINGFQVNPYFYIGLGIGLDNYYESFTHIGKVGYPYLPIFANVRTMFINGKVSPYLSLSGGYSINTGPGPGSGFMLNPSLGLTIHISSAVDCLFGIGFKTQAYSIYQYQGHFNSLQMQGGIDF